MSKVISVRFLAYLLSFILILVQSIYLNTLNFSIVLYFSVSIGIFSLLDLGSGPAFTRSIAAYQLANADKVIAVYAFSRAWYLKNMRRVFSQVGASSLIYLCVSALLMKKISLDKVEFSTSLSYLVPFLFSQTIPILSRVLNLNMSGHVTYYAQSIGTACTILAYIPWHSNSDFINQYSAFFLVIQFGTQSIIMLAYISFKEPRSKVVTTSERFTFTDFKTQSVQILVIVNFLILNLYVANLEKLESFQEFQFNNRLMSIVIGISSVVVLNRSMAIATGPLHTHFLFLKKILLFSTLLSTILFSLIIPIEALEVSSNIPKVNPWSQILWIMNVPLQLFGIYAAYLFLLRMKFRVLFVALTSQFVVLNFFFFELVGSGALVLLLSQSIFCLVCFFGLKMEHDWKFS
jgi:hypothetical protein